MKNFISILVLTLICSAGTASNTVVPLSDAIGQDVFANQIVDVQNQLKVSDLIGLSANTLSEELSEKLNLIGISFGHGIFATYEQCIAFDPECVCLPHSGMRWICFIR